MAKVIFENVIRTVPSPDHIPDNTELWRYMKLSTFLMLLRRKVFVPTIAELRFGDPKEARNLSVQTRTYFDNLQDSDREWLLGRSSASEHSILNDSRTDSHQRASIYIAIWDRELAQRRRLWCWHEADIESMALWHIYAMEGVAIQTTPARIKAAFDPSFVDTALIARVQYIDDARKEDQEHHFMRPYLFKQRCYQHEREVRVIFPRDSDCPDNRRLLPIDPRMLISSVRISPHLPRSEAEEIRQSLVHAWRIGDQIDASDDDPKVFVSDTTTVQDSPLDSFLHSECETPGITNFGSINMPFVMCGDFRANDG
jgi:hypothetical protein